MSLGLTDSVTETEAVEWGCCLSFGEWAQGRADGGDRGAVAASSEPLGGRRVGADGGTSVALLRGLNACDHPFAAADSDAGVTVDEVTAAP